MTGSTNVVQVTNIAPQATKDQMQSLFGHLGKIEEIRLYPTIRDVSCPVHARICYVKYFDNSSVQVAQHLTNTVFIDRALIVVPVQNGLIPDEYRALEMTNNGTTVPGLYGGDSKLPPEVVNRIDGIAPNQFVKTTDPKLEMFNLPEYPNLPANLDARRIEEIRRTVCVYDIPSDMKLDDLMEHFASAGEIKYARWAEKNHAKYAMIEFCEQKDIIEALKLHGSSVRGDTVCVYHSCDAISKPEAKSNEAAQREIEEAMSIVKEAQSMISSIDPVFGVLSKDKVAASSSSRRRSSRSRSRERSHRHSRSPSRRSRSRKRSKSRGRSRKSRSKSRRRSRSRSKRSVSRAKRSRSRSRSKRSRSKERRSHSKRSRSKDRRVRRSRSRPRRSSRSRSRGSRSRRSRSRSRRRSKSRDRKKSRKADKHRRSRSRSASKRRSPSKAHSSRTKEEKRSKKRSRSKESKHRSKKTLEEKVARDYDAEEKIGEEEKLVESGASKRSDKSSPSPAKSDIMDISNSP